MAVRSALPASAHPVRAAVVRLRARTWIWWSLTRAVGIAVACTALLRGWPLGTDGLAGDVLRTYSLAHDQLLAHHVPYRDFLFEYPPGAIPFVVLPWGMSASAHRLSFLLVYASQMLVFDALITRALLRAPGPRARNAAMLWVDGGALTLGLYLCRNDLPACAAAVIGLFALLEGRRVRMAVALAIGGVAKVWPVQLLVLAGAAVRERRLRLAGIATLVMLIALAPFAALGALRGMEHDLVGYHGSRGVEIESVAALPQVLAGALTRRPVALTFDHGSTNLAGSAVVGSVCSVVCAALFVAIAGVLWHRRRTAGLVRPGHVVLACCLLVVVQLLSSKVFSPQYLSWLLAVAAVGSASGCVDARDRTLILGAVLATSLEYPFDFDALGAGGVTSMMPALLLLVRDLALLALAVRWTRRFVFASDGDVAT